MFWVGGTEAEKLEPLKGGRMQAKKQAGGQRNRPMYQVDKSRFQKVWPKGGVPSVFFSSSAPLLLSTELGCHPSKLLVVS